MICASLEWQVFFYVILDAFLVVEVFFAAYKTKVLVFRIVAKHF